MYKNDLEKEKGLLLNAKKDKEEFGKLYEYFVNDVYRYSYSLLLNKENAQDVTSQVFMEFYKKVDSYIYKGVSIKGWLFITARNKVFNNFIQKKQMESFDQNNEYAGEVYDVSFVDQIINQDLINIAQKEIEGLDPVSREIVKLRIWEGIKFKEIADIQGSTETSVKKRFYRSIDKIRKNLENKGHLKLVALPVLFTAIYKVGSNPTYASFPSSNTGSLFIKGNIMDNQKSGGVDKINLNAFFSSTQGKIISVGLASVILVGSAAGTLAMVGSDNESQQDAPLQAENLPTPTPTTVITPTPSVDTTPTSIPSPAPTAEEILEVTPLPDESSTLNDSNGNEQTGYGNVFHGINIRTTRKYEVDNSVYIGSSFNAPSYINVKEVDDILANTVFDEQYLIIDERNPNLFELTISNSPDFSPREYSSEASKISSTANFGDIYRVQVKETGSIYYVNDIALNQGKNCKDANGNIYKSPCGRYLMDFGLGDKSKN